MRVPIFFHNDSSFNSKYSNLLACKVYSYVNWIFFRFIAVMNNKSLLIYYCIIWQLHHNILPFSHIRDVLGKQPTFRPLFVHY